MEGLSRPPDPRVPWVPGASIAVGLTVGRPAGAWLTDLWTGLIWELVPWVRRALQQVGNAL